MKFHSLSCPRIRQMLSILFLCLIAWVNSPAQSGSFSSGSTGADGAFAPTANQTIVVSETGVYNFTTINVPSGVTITFIRSFSAKNVPVTLLASGDVTIAGTISVAGKPGANAVSGGFGGPGGFNGGSGGSGYDTFIGTTGDGPGGGNGGTLNAGSTSTVGTGGGGGGYASVGGNGQFGFSTPTPGGPRYGTATLTPLIGGSGGGGGTGFFTGSAQPGGGGGGGGGAILIASSTKITMTGTINADGGNGGFTGGTGGGGGAGGAIRLIANEITGGGTLLARGGSGGGATTGSLYTGGSGGGGYVRLEAYNPTFTGPATPATVTTIPGTINNATLPSLAITKVAGVSVAVNPRGSLVAQPDVIVPATQTNPVTVELATVNIPLGTTIQLTVTPVNGARSSVNSLGITGTVAQGTTTASVTLPSGLCVLSATATYALAQSSSLRIQGERVERVEVAALSGQPSTVVYITTSGKRIPAL